MRIFHPITGGCKKYVRKYVRNYKLINFTTKRNYRNYVPSRLHYRQVRIICPQICEGLQVKIFHNKTELSELRPVKTNIEDPILILSCPLFRIIISWKRASISGLVSFICSPLGPVKKFGKIALSAHKATSNPLNDVTSTNFFLFLYFISCPFLLYRAGWIRFGSQVFK